MTATPNAAAHVQRQLNDVSARLAQLAKESPDLPVYLKAHAECVLQLLRPQGLSYEMLAGRSFQRIIASKWDALQLKESPELAESFRKAIHRVAETGHPVTLPPRLQPAGNLPGLQPQDAPAPEELSLFNSTDWGFGRTPIFGVPAALPVLGSTWTTTARPVFPDCPSPSPIVTARARAGLRALKSHRSHRQKG